MKTQCIGKNAFDTVYDANMEKVYKVALYYSRDEEKAKDITQQVFLTLYINMDNINVDNVEPWLKRTAKHMALNEKKARITRYEFENPVPEVESVVDKDVYVESLEDCYFRNLDINARRDLADEIYEKLYEKNQRWYEAMTVTYVLQKPQKEVAETMGISVNGLQMILYRAKRWIRKRFQEQYDHLDEG